MLQRHLQIITGMKARSGENITDAPVEVFDPTMGLQVACLIRRC